MASIADTLRTGSKRARIHDAQTVLKHPKRVKELVGEIADRQGVSEASIWREALAEYLERRGYRA